MSFSYFILDDDPLAVSRLECLLTSYRELTHIGSECLPGKAIPYIRSHKPDILFLDIEMPGISGFEVVEAVQNGNYSPVVIFVTAYDHFAIEAIKKSAFDYILKPVCRDELKQTILHLEEKLPGKTSQTVDLKSLTKREKEIYLLLKSALTSRQIAHQLNISVHTVDTHRRRILKKLNACATREILANRS